MGCGCPALGGFCRCARAIETGSVARNSRGIGLVLFPGSKNRWSDQTGSGRSHCRGRAGQPCPTTNGFLFWCFSIRRIGPLLIGCAHVSTGSVTVFVSISLISLAVMKQISESRNVVSASISTSCTMRDRLFVYSLIGNAHGVSFPIETIQQGIPRDRPRSVQDEIEKEDAPIEGLLQRGLG